MHRASESIASLAAALAKAQMLLTNPEKSLTATVRTERYDEAGRTFRYAPLSSGLDIVRKALGQHEIATVQTTAIDQDTQTVSLTTVLAHSSGEWIASDWPVCALSEMATPRRMGAALTYARRYALFTLVGIAGEEDMDAPDLAGAPVKSGRAEKEFDTGKANGTGAADTFRSFSANRERWSPPKLATLDPERSAALRDQLLGELGTLGSQQEVTAWAQRALAAKNALTSDDAGLVEAAFALMAKGFAETGFNEEPPHSPSGTIDREAVAGTTTDPATIGPGLSPEATPPGPSAPQKRRRRHTASAAPAPAGDQIRSPTASAESAVRVNDAVAWHIDKSALALSEPRRYRDRAHLEFVASQPCLLCGRRPSDAHHLRFAQPRALGRRVSDEFAVPLCRTHHRVLHSRGDEAAWWKAVKFDPVVVAQRLWEYTRLNGAPRHRRLGTPLADETAPTPATEGEAADQKVDGAGLKPKETSAGPADDRPQTPGGEQVDPPEPSKRCSIDP
jgi:ERF superfamily